MHNELCSDGMNYYTECSSVVLLTKDYGKYSITNSETWDTENFVRELNIEPGGELTINSTEIRIASDAKIYVKKGGKLIINNSLLTSACENEYWPGIQVWGDPNLSQTSTNQGVIELYDAVVSNF